MKKIKEFFMANKISKTLYLIILIPSTIGLILSYLNDYENFNFWAIWFIQFMLVDIWDSLHDKKNGMALLQIFTYIIFMSIFLP